MSDPVKPFDKLLVERRVAELTHRACDCEFRLAVVLTAQHILAASSVDDDAVLKRILDEFGRDTRFQQATMRGAMKARAMIERAKGGGNVH